MKFENEITVEVDITLKDLIDLLNKSGCILNQEYDVNDIYMVKNNIDLNGNTLEILNNCLLIRNIITDTKNMKTITYKYKECGDDGKIIKNGKVNCCVNSINEAKNLLEVIGYKELLVIKDHLMVYSNDFTEFCIQIVNNKHIYIEMEEDNEFTGKHYNNINDMINDFNKLNIPIKGNDYFVKKAMVEFNEQYR